ncbi:MAG: 50S ribosomal protein L11 [Nanoarchaeota archaeon]|nr:50S ribosomal protein L11 [Nanoarchaeota archaeon]
MKMKLLVDGGSMKPGPALSQKLGPAGINIGEVLSKINEVTSGFKGMKVPVELDIDITTKTFEIEVFSPPVSELLKKEAEIDKGSKMQARFKSGNLSIEQIINVAKQKMGNLLCNTLKTAVKTVVGSCVSLGLLIESKTPQEIEKEIEEGIYDKQIEEGIIETSEEKKKELKEYFSKLKAEQDKIILAEKKAAEVEAENKEKE